MATITKTLQEGFRPFSDYKEHLLARCDKCKAPIKATKVNGPAVADSNNNITGAFFLNLWLCRQCYESLVVKNGIVTFGGIGIQ